MTNEEIKENKIESGIENTENESNNEINAESNSNDEENNQSTIETTENNEDKDNENEIIKENNESEALPTDDEDKDIVEEDSQANQKSQQEIETKEQDLEKELSQMKEKIKKLEYEKKLQEAITGHEKDEFYPKLKIKESKFKTIKEKIIDTTKTFKPARVEVLFEKVRDAQTIFNLERKIQKYILLFGFVMMIISIVEFMLIIALLPLKEKEPYLVGFSNATQSFVTISKADETITTNDGLVRTLIGAYIYNREEINRIDDKSRHEKVRLQSNPQVWHTFENLVAQEQSIYANSGLIRQVEIIDIIKYKDGYAYADVAIRLYTKHNMELQSDKRYKIVVVYKFNEQKISFDLLPQNPTGFMVVDYVITETHIIKELDEKHKLDKSKSRITLPASNQEKNKQELDIYNKKEDYSKDEIKNEMSKNESTNVNDFITPF